MKTLGSLMVMALAAAPLLAQETLLDSESQFGGYGGPVVQFTSVNGQFGVLVGGGGGVVVDHAISVGGAGYGLVNNVSIADAPAGMPYMNLGYGGGYLQYIHTSNSLLHFTVSVLVGGGSVSYRSDSFDDGSTDDRDSTNDAFFVAEPNVEAELNIMQHFRVAFGAGYRFVSGVQLGNLDNADIGGPNVRLMLKFGSF